MEYRHLGASGLKVSALGFGAGTFGGKGSLSSARGNSDAGQARRIDDVCLDAGVDFFDTADAYSDGAPESILDAASAVTPPYPCHPYWNGRFAERNPPPIHPAPQEPA